MKSLSEQNHYEILEVPRASDAAEIKRAYQLSMATYADEALAGYSIFEDGDAEMIRERVETAYRVLSDDDTRRAYDESLQAWWSDESGAISTVALSAGEVEVPEARPLPPPLVPLQALGVGAAATGASGGGVGRPPQVHPVYRRVVEEGRFEALPARVYVRGFVTAYASCLGLDSRRAVESYMRRFDSSGPEPQRRFSKGG